MAPTDRALALARCVADAYDACAGAGASDDRLTFACGWRGIDTPAGDFLRLHLAHHFAVALDELDLDSTSADAIRRLPTGARVLWHTDEGIVELRVEPPPSPGAFLARSADGESVVDAPPGADLGDDLTIPIEDRGGELRTGQFCWEVNLGRVVCLRELRSWTAEDVEYSGWLLEGEPDTTRSPASALVPLHHALVEPLSGAPAFAPPDFDARLEAAFGLDRAEAADQVRNLCDRAARMDRNVRAEGFGAGYTRLDDRHFALIAVHAMLGVEAAERSAGWMILVKGGRLADGQAEKLRIALEQMPTAPRIPVVDPDLHDCVMWAADPSPLTPPDDPRAYLCAECGASGGEVCRGDGEVHQVRALAPLAIQRVACPHCDQEPGYGCVHDPEGFPLAFVHVERLEMASVRSCRVCGCTDEQACITDDGPCTWIGPDLCSGCATKARVVETVEDLRAAVAAGEVVACTPEVARQAAEAGLVALLPGSDGGEALGRVLTPDDGPDLHLVEEPPTWSEPDQCPRDPDCELEAGHAGDCGEAE